MIAHPTDSASPGIHTFVSDFEEVLTCFVSDFEEVVNFFCTFNSVWWIYFVYKRPTLIPTSVNLFSQRFTNLFQPILMVMLEGFSG